MPSYVKKYYQLVRNLCHVLQIDPIVFGGSVVLSGLGCFGTNSEDVPTKIGYVSESHPSYVGAEHLTQM